MNEIVRLFSLPVSTRLVHFLQRQPSKTMADNMQKIPLNLCCLRGEIKQLSKPGHIPCSGVLYASNVVFSKFM